MRCLFELIAAQKNVNIRQIFKIAEIFYEQFRVVFAI